MTELSLVHRRRLSSRFCIVLFTAWWTLLLAGCTTLNETRLEDSLGRNVNLIDFSYEIADDLISQAFPPLRPRNPDMPILTTTFVDNNKLEQTSQFGRLIQDHIGARFVQNGYTVKEVRLRSDLEIEPHSGETILSRRLALLRDAQPAQAILVGTVSMAQRTLYISARLVNPTDTAIIAARNYRLYMDRHVLAMFGLKPIGDSDDIKAPSEPAVNRIFY